MTCTLKTFYIAKVMLPENFLLLVTFVVIRPLTLKSSRHLLYVLSGNVSKEFIKTRQASPLDIAYQMRVQIRH